MSKKIEIEKLISFSDDLVELLKNERDTNTLDECLEQLTTLNFQCEADYINIHKSLKEYDEKIDSCKKKIDAAKSEVVADEEIELLQKDLEEEIQRESFLKEELRVIGNDINMLDLQRISIENRREILKRLEQDATRAQTKLSLYASVTNIIPNLDGRSGHIVNRDKKFVDKFEFDSMSVSDFDICNNIWKMIDQ